VQRYTTSAPKSPKTCSPGFTPVELFFPIIAPPTQETSVKLVPATAPLNLPHLVLLAHSFFFPYPTFV
jgi:hypothetical protein